VRVLLVEGDVGAAAAAETELRAAGHEIVGCEAADASAPCRGLEPIGECPLDAHDIDVAVVGRRGGPLAPSERGALCAARHRIPVVIAGDGRSAVSFGPGTHMAQTDLVGACERAAGSGDAHVAAIRRDLLMSGVLTSSDIDGRGATVRFDVRREPNRLRLVVHTPPDDPRTPAIVKSASEALRRFDSHMKVIDVVVS
jgi:hypothetical protein